MSRSLGDLEAHELGVTEAPEIVEYTIPEDSEHMLLIASDGLWEHVTNEEAMRMSKG